MEQMVVYVEYSLIDNLVINYLILQLTVLLLNIKTKWWKIVLSAGFGSLIALFYPLMNQNFSFIIKIILGISMPLIILTKYTKKTVILSTSVFFLITGLMGGAILLICSMFNLNFIQNNGSYYIYNFPIGLILLICIFTFIILKNLIKYFYKRKYINQFKYTIKIFCGENMVECSAFLDSGNIAFDKESGFPIIFINYKTFIKLCPSVKLSQILVGNFDEIPLKNIHLSNVSSINTTQSTILFEIDKLEILNEESLNINSVMCGLSLNSFKNLNCDCILNGSLI